MSRAVNLEKGTEGTISHESFAFLERCLDSRSDLTSAESLDPESTGILVPKKISTLMATVKSVDLREVHGRSRGEDSTLQECVTFFNRHGIGCSKENVSLSVNILSALEHVYRKLHLSEANKIIVPTPTFGYYFKQFQDNKIGFETLPTKAENNFLIDAEALEKMIVETGAKTLLLCYPNNPTGAVMTKENALAIAEVVKRHDVFVISDEAFISNSLSDKKHFSIAAVDGMLDRSFTVTSAAKSMFIGNKTGFCVGHPEILSGLEMLGGYPTKHTQKIMSAAIEDSAENTEYLEQCRTFYLRNIDLIGTKISELNKKFCDQFSEEQTFVKPFITKPDAANVYLLDFSGLRGKRCGDKVLNSGLDVAQWLLDDAKVGTVPGECFLFEPETMLVRIALNHAPRELEVAFNSMIEATVKIESPAHPAPISADLVVTSTRSRE